MPTTAGIIDFALHPPLGLLTNKRDVTGPYSGDNLLTTWNDSGTIRNVSDTFGVLVIVDGAIPPKLGLTLGCSMGGSSIFEGDEYQQRLAQVVVQHQLFPVVFGGWVTTQIVDTHSLATLILWQEALPGRIGLRTLPGISMDLQYLRAL
jgi:hypothetical protein